MHVVVTIRPLPRASYESSSEWQHADWYAWVMRSIKNIHLQKALWIRPLIESRLECRFALVVSHVRQKQVSVFGDLLEFGGLFLQSSCNAKVIAAHEGLYLTRAQAIECLLKPSMQLATSGTHVSHFRVLGRPLVDNAALATLPRTWQACDESMTRRVSA